MTEKSNEPQILECFFIEDGKFFIFAKKKAAEVRHSSRVMIEFVGTKNPYVIFDVKEHEDHTILAFKDVAQMKEYCISK